MKFALVLGIFISQPIAAQESTVISSVLSVPVAESGNSKVIDSKNLNHNNIGSSSIPTYDYLISNSKKQYLWFDDSGLTMSGLSLHRLLADLGWHQQIKVTSIEAESFKAHDEVLTLGFLKLLNLNESSSQENLSDGLLEAIDNDSTDELLLSLIPNYDQISHLRKAISQYRFLSSYQWPKLDPSFKPKLGQSHKNVAAIRNILVNLGDLPKKAQTQYRLDVYDSVVVAALKKFQERHGLTVDGKLGPQTYRALSVTPKQRVVQLQTNLWRWFTLPKEAPENYLLVNIPGYQLAVVEGGEQVMQMKVIVGDNDNQTPQMITEINRVTLNPTWTPTPNIIKNELIPEFEQDYLSLKRKNFQLVKGYWKNAQTREIDDPNLNLAKLLKSYRLVQAPGDNNALGYYRFNIPNDYSVYLHDTPIKSLFNRSERALSHGCIRLEDAKLLANYLINSETSVKPEKVNKALQSGKTTNLPLNNPLPVYITYQTAWINEQGELRLSPDIYNLDHNNSSNSQFHATDSNPVISISQNNF
ncbi:murein L,D-transpeptidase [Thalassomonas sp. M1454]|uniref:L,D-transpeptidase family protein n=1 Tax=Thalassomonas sp. M1454 TaxID=2594477 RepID=UPI001180BC87|nr:L,D-transpeptidase family protein [Thalassomonas sp. M1454]TRX54448.1 L,D-transpeptidase family protein [Thalassomonas sp. M1454]